MRATVIIMRELDDAIRAQAYAYLQGEEPLEAFERWTVRHTWDEPPLSLGARVDSLLSERHLLSEDELREELRVLVATIEVAERPTTTVLGSTSVVYEHTGSLLTHGSQTVRVSRELVGT